MYFPYLRGRQFELIALRELAQKGILSKKIIPIVEPVKLTSTLIKTMDIYEKEKRGISLVINPEVGQFQMDCQEPKNEKLIFEISRIVEENENLYHTIILTPNNKIFVENFISNNNKKVMAVCDNKDAILAYEECLADKDIKYNLIPDDSGFRRRIRNNRVMKEDKFNKLDRNTDYEKVNDEHFSDDHLYYLEDGYIGFSDYSIVGNDYSDTGFAPYAVAIHIVYFDEDDSLRIKHFVSDSNDDISDPAGKFKEALSKLVKWNKTMKLTTSGIKEFENLYVNEAYPGLGTVKKLSIMHHLELIGQFLDKE